ncbi:MAG: hypothetical protein ACM3RX_06105 [Methanococcaceae archaeon]
MSFIKNILIFLVLLFFYTGCTPTVVKEEIFLQSVNVAGPINHPPILITGKDQGKKITVSPKFIFNNSREVKARVNSSRVNSSGFFEVDTIYKQDGSWDYIESNKNKYTFTGSNLNWDLPEIYSGVDLDVPISKSISLIGALSYSFKNGKNLMGGAFGFSSFSSSETIATRFSFGLNIQEYLYDASTVVITTTKEYSGKEATTILFYHDIDKNSKLNIFMSLTFNSHSEKLPFNFLLGVNYFGQTLLNFEPSDLNIQRYPWGVQKYTTDTRGEASTGYLSLSPGIYTNISESSRILFGTCIIKELGGLENFSHSILVLPFVKVDFLL